MLTTPPREGVRIQSCYNILPKIFNFQQQYERFKGRGTFDTYSGKKQGTETVFEKNQMSDLTRQRL